MDWDALRIFLAVAEAGSLSAAARRLRLSQPTVGRRVAALEAELDSRLIERTGRGLMLTADGEALAESARRMEAEALSAARRLSGRDSELSGAVRISSTEGVGIGWLTPRLRRFGERYPGIDVELVVDNRAVNLSRREADIALRMRAVVSRRHASPPQESLIGRRLGTLAMALYASRDYLQRHGEPADAAALGGHHLIGFDDSLADAGYAGWLGGLAVGARTPFSANSLQAHLMAIRAGFGIGITSRVLAREHPELVPVLPDLTPPMPEVWLLYHADLKGAARVRAALDFLIEEIQADPDMLLRE